MDWIIAWWPATVLGPIVLAAVLACALATTRRLTPREKARQHEAVERVYDEKSSRE